MIKRLWQSIERRVRRERDKLLEKWGLKKPDEPEPEKPPTPDPDLPPPSNRFLWKPISEHGRLVILTGANLNGKISKVVIMRGGAKVERGRFVGEGSHNGQRGHYRFSKRGGEYGTGLETWVHLKEGNIMRYSIPDGAQRYDGIRPI